MQLGRYFKKGGKSLKTISIQVPDSVDMDVKEVKFIIASRLYEQGRLSLGEASEVAGVSKRTFVELLGEYGVSVFNYDPEELESDYKNA